MDLQTLLSFHWDTMMPEFIILISATVLSLIDLFIGRSFSRKFFGWASFIAVVAALVSLISLSDHGVTTILNNSYVFDSFSIVFKAILLIGTALVILMAISDKFENIEEVKSEYFYLLMTGLLGAMFMSSSGDLITLFIGLELLSISSYILVAIRKENSKSNEAAMKYIINGSIASAILLFGLSYIYGLTGSTDLAAVQQIVSTLSGTELSGLLGLSFLFIIVGFTFKIAAAPFHMWAPDVYQGASTPVAAFLSVVSKSAGFIIIIRVLLNIYAGAYSPDGQLPLLINMQNYIFTISAITIILGNAVALMQTNIKRMFAYSSVAHAGYILVPLAAVSPLLFENIWFYLLAYTVTNIGAFAVIQYVVSDENNENIEAFRGLYKRKRSMAIALLFFLISLAGIPGTVGFIAKLQIIASALANNPINITIVVIMILGTLVSYFYYFRVIAEMFFKGDRLELQPPKNEIPFNLIVVIGVCVAATIVLGLMPNLALDNFYKLFS
ncbi:MAG: NADH:ubiquinone oxidoreductase subunit [Bacillales bacterium]|nr:NADH:ubiquinone oxidoreductase subunit [Bacillales bacterium]